jgi:hypothetical protein
MADPERRFRVEGLFELLLETADARGGEASGRLLFQIAGSASAVPNRTTELCHRLPTGRMIAASGASWTFRWR